ncbi:MAG: hypothetical protein M0042_08290 [Nitrospiraceae bacterium]|nr:hypothetical protein [Nitrospiraceae bacterium]
MKGISAFVLFAAFVFNAAALSSCGSSSTNTGGASSSPAVQIVACPTAPAATVAITNSSFQPTGTAIAVNGIVKWTNNDSIAHTVTSGSQGTPDGTFDSGNLSQNATVCIQFLEIGSYSYFCKIHPFMTGVVAVQ